MAVILRITTCCLLAGLASCPPCPANKNGGAPPAKESQPLSVNFCDLVKSPKGFDGREVRVKAVYRYGEEWSELYSLRCVSEKVWETGVWAAGTRASCQNPDVPAEELSRSGATPNGRAVGVVVVGTFHASERGYGHMKGFAYELEIKCVERAEVLLREVSWVPQALTPEQRRKVEAFEDSD